MRRIFRRNRPDIPMREERRRLTGALAASLALHVAVILWLSVTGTPSDGQGGDHGAPTAHLTARRPMNVTLSDRTHSADAQRRESIEHLLIVVRSGALPAANSAIRTTQDDGAGGSGGSQTSYRTGFNDEPPEPDRYPVLALPTDTDLPAYLPARLRWPITPRYPDSAFAARVRGHVRLDLLVDRGGEILSMRISESAPEGIFDDSALHAFRGVRFEPALEHGEAVASRVSVKIVYDPDDMPKPLPAPAALNWPPR